MEGRRWGREKEKPFLSSVHASVLCAKFSLSCTRNWLSYWRRGEVRLGIILLSPTAPPAVPIEAFHVHFVLLLTGIIVKMVFIISARGVINVVALLLTSLSYALSFSSTTTSHTHTHTLLQFIFFN